MQQRVINVARSVSVRPLIVGALTLLLLGWQGGSGAGQDVPQQRPAEATAALDGGENQVEPADVVVRGGVLLVCNSPMQSASAMAVRDGRIVVVGSDAQVAPHIGPGTRVVELEGACVTPGLCDSHLHFVGLGTALQQLDLRDAPTWEAVVAMVAERAAQLPPGSWIEGRGWHQSKWSRVPVPDIDGYPTHWLLSEAVPEHPVLLTHASGHACLANAAAMRLAGVDAQTSSPAGGQILCDTEGEPIGVFQENAQRLIQRALDRDLRRMTAEQRREQLEQRLALAGAECLRFGITGVHDAGSSLELVDQLGELADADRLPLRMYVMLREPSERLLSALSRYRWIDRGDGFLTVRAVKVSIDGALGPHGAWLLQPYADVPGSSGLNTTDLVELRRLAQLCDAADWQLCVHAIGDRANQEVLDVMQQQLGVERAADRRWRIEHAQHLDPIDIPRMGQLGIIPAMQANHCTSDAAFVVARLGQRRASEGAYAWRSLIDAGCIIPNGTDAPVEPVDPRVSLHAAVTRRLADGEAFFPQQCMTRREALLSYTLWPAIASFQEHQLGSLEAGKRADFVVWDRDLLRCSDDELLDAQVRSTWIAGRPRYTATP